MRHIIESHELTKHFKSVRALDNVSFQIGAGRIVGLAGQNGSGKSTLLNHLIGLYLPDSGACSLLGSPSKSLDSTHLSKIGHVPQNPKLIDWMTVAELMRFLSAYYPTWNNSYVEEFIAQFKVPLKSKIKELSDGTRQKVAILAATAFEPELLLLDEPAASMDLPSRLQFLDILIEMIQKENRTIMISSHIMGDIEKIIDYIMIIDEGKLVRNCPFDELKEEFVELEISAMTGEIPDTFPFVNQTKSRSDKKKALITVKNPGELEIRNFEEKYGCRIRTRNLSLEELYMAILSRHDAISEDDDGKALPVEMQKLLRLE